MIDWQELWKVINSDNISIERELNITKVRDNSAFKGMSCVKQKEVVDMLNAAIFEELQRQNPDIITATELKRIHDSRGIPAILDLYSGDVKGSIGAVRDFFAGYGAGRGYGGFGSIQGGVHNAMTGNGMYGADPYKAMQTTPNVWINPYEANSIYTQKGIPELIIKKKSHSILLNGVRIENVKYTPKQLDKIKESILRTNFDYAITQATNWSLVYGGALMFPKFKGDTPLSMTFNINQLLKSGLLKKDCIQRFITLDRWNVVHIPQWNPTSADFLTPNKYFIPFLGSDVNGDRCARIVTSPSAGYWGNIISQGWGESDFTGWYESALNYMSVMQSIPTMINQMNVLARTINIDGLLATEGTAILDDLIEQDTIRVRHSSNINDPVNLDVVGSLQAIQRDFKEVPNLVKLIRQDLGAKAHIPEELLFSSERGAFSSGDNTKGQNEKQLENIKFIHKDIAQQLRNIVYIQVIDALGATRDVLENLQYTRVSFDDPPLANADDRAEFYKNITTGLFNEVSALIPADLAMKITSQVGGSDLAIDSSLIEEVSKRQEKIDSQNEIKFKKEMELLDAQIENARNPKVLTGGSTGASSTAKPKEEGKTSHNYENRLEIKQHQKVSTEKTQTKTP